MSYEKNYCDLCGKYTRCCWVETDTHYYNVKVCEYCAREILNCAREILNELECGERIVSEEKIDSMMIKLTLRCERGQMDGFDPMFDMRHAGVVRVIVKAVLQIQLDNK